MDNFPNLVRAAIALDNLRYRMVLPPCDRCPACETPCPYDALSAALEDMGLNRGLYSSFGSVGEIIEKSMGREGERQQCEKKGPAR